MAPSAHKKRKLSPLPDAVIEARSNNDDLSASSLDGESEPSNKKAAQDQSHPTKYPRGQVQKRHVPLLSGTYASSMFLLQLDELLSKVRLDYERRMVTAENALRKLKGIIERIPDREAVSVRSSLIENFLICFALTSIFRYRLRRQRPN